MTSPKLKYTTETAGVVKTHTLRWEIPYSDIENNKTRELRSNKSISSEAKVTDLQFLLKLQFLGQKRDIVEIYYLSHNPGILSSKVTCCGWYNGSSAETLSEFTVYNTVPANKWQYLTRSMMSSVKKWSNSELTLEFEIREIQVDHLNVPEAKTVGIDLEQLLNNGLFSDVTMKSAEDVEYRVHKAVLASRSAVLKAHFEHNTTECFTNVVESPLESEVLREVLTFVYSNKAPKVDEIPEKLLAAADYYQLNRLKSLCEEALQKKLTVENAIETLQLADLHSANTLKQLTLEFIKDDNIELIIKTDGWIKLTSVELIKTIFEYIEMSDDVEANTK